MVKRFQADVTLLFVTFIWGATFVIVQNAIQLLPPVTFNAVRFFLAGILLVCWLFLFTKKENIVIKKQSVLAGCFMGIWLFGGYAFQTVGLMYTSSAKAGFITGLSVVLVPLFTFILLKQRPTKLALVGVFVAAIGLYFLTMSGSSNLNKGDLLVFFCSISFALHIVFTGKYSSKHSALILTIIQLFTVAILSTVYAFFTENWLIAFQPNILFSFDVLLALIICAIFATAFAYLVQTNVQKYTTPTRVALIFAMEPVFAALTAFLWIQERLHAAAIVGCILIFSGMILAEWPQKKRKRKKIAA
ncbi:DMT family transporter [Bacillus sp. HMF5848]|uniref:DMT family transporter n=1 Tax=Bacillus sp. HMF5848 TaxID=2495421 RepID=UPI000F7686A1|nr:DMT family transporter [Bacillus sp. HMF5848]RSK27324.1 DMT family transporter [Bacillus sp. HMF5848]